MSRYLLYGLVVESALPLPLPEIFDEQVDVRLDVTEFDWEDVWSQNNGGSIVGSGVKGLVRFIVEEGRTVRLAIEDYEALDTVHNMVTGAIMAVVLWQRGYLVLHASAVAHGGQAVAFVADSGWGKSTTAEFLCQQGYRLVNDDVIAIRFDGEDAIIVAGFPRIKLREGAAKWLRKDYVSLRGVVDKRHSEWDSAFSAGELPLKRVFFLEADPAEITASTPMSMHDAVRETIRHTRVLNLFTDPAYRRNHLQQCSRFLRTVQYCRLERRRSLADLIEIQRVVERHTSREHVTALV